MKLRMTLLLLPVLMFCTTQTAGPTTEEGNPPVLAGIVVGTDGKPSCQAKVSLFSSTSEPDSLSPSTVAKEESSIATDSNGYFEFEKLSSGIYTLKCVNVDTTAFALLNDITVQPEIPLNLDTITLDAPGVIKGTVTRGGILGSNSNPTRQDGFIDVYVNEINYHTVTSLNGNYKLSNVPSGSYSLVFYAADGFYVFVKDSITVNPGDTTIIPQFELKRIPWLPPPKPLNLSAFYSKVSKTARLSWNTYENGNIIGFKVERRIDPLLTDTVFTTKNIYFTDSLSAFFTGTTVYYVIRSVNDRFVESYNEGPVSITIQ